MKKLWNLAFGYFFAAMAGGVFYREFTKYFGFTGETALGYLHVHLLVLGTVLFLFLGLPPYYRSVGVDAVPYFFLCFPSSSCPSSLSLCFSLSLLPPKVQICWRRSSSILL